MVAGRERLPEFKPPQVQGITELPSGRDSDNRQRSLVSLLEVNLLACFGHVGRRNRQENLLSEDQLDKSLSGALFPTITTTVRVAECLRQRAPVILIEVNRGPAPCRSEVLGLRELDDDLVVVDRSQMELRLMWNIDPRGDRACGVEGRSSEQAADAPAVEELDGHAPIPIKLHRCDAVEEATANCSMW